MFGFVTAHNTSVFVIPTTGALEQPRRRIPPSSITLVKPQKTATNPIYEGGGPIYDSPSDPLKTLLSHSTPSTPSTPSGSSPRYFNMPPQLPPPRKTSISSPFSPTLCTSPTQVEKIQASFNAEVPPSDEAYTVMRPATKSLSRPNKPSPLVIPNSCLNTHDEYVTVI